MTIDTATLPQRTLVETEAPTLPTQNEPQTTEPQTTVASPVVPRLRRRGAGRVLLDLLIEANRRPTRDPLMLLGPNGGPLWTSQSR